MPARVPLSGGTQAVAHRLVTAALLLISASAALSPAFARSGPPPRAAHTISSTDRGGSHAPQGTTGPEGGRARGEAAAGHSSHGPRVQKIYIVKPPVGRFHESLWEIAENHLGNGLRYREIFAMNEGRVQPDGTRLTIASLIRPGWILRMPRDAYGPGIEIVSHTPGGSASAAEQAGARQAKRASQDAVGAQGNGSGSARDSAAVPGGSRRSWRPRPRRRRPVSHRPQPRPGRVRQRAALLPLRAFGRIAARRGGAGRARPAQARAALAARVRSAGRDPGRRRRPGRGGDAARRERTSARLLDTGLRSLSQELAMQGKAPPTVFATHLGQVNLDLWIAPADKNPPQPWQSVDDGQVWRLPLAAVAGLDPDEAGAALAPYPGLVSIGTSDTGRMLIDLEVAQGLIAVRGSRRMVQAVLAAMAVELATNRWSDRMQITLVGFGPELAMLAPERITVAQTLDEALPALETRAAEVEHSLASLRTDSVLTGRSRGVHPDSWAPHYLIMAVPPTPQQRERLLALASTRHRTAMGYVVAGDVPGATWSWDVTEQGRLHAGVLGFDLKAQLLPPQQYAAVVELFRAAGQEGGVTLGDPPPDAAPPGQLVPGARMAVEVRLLGQVAVEAPGGIEPDRVGGGDRGRHVPGHASRRRPPERARRRGLAARGHPRGSARRRWPGCGTGSGQTAPAVPTWSSTAPAG